MIQLGIRLHDVAGDSFEKLLQNASAQGFGCAHIALTKTMPDVHVTAETLTPGFAMYFKHMCDKYGVDPAVLGCYLNLGYPQAEGWHAIEKMYKAHFSFARLSGCGVVGTETGNPNLEYKPDAHTRDPEVFELFLRHLEPLVKAAEACGVTLAIEPVCRHIVYNAKIARSVLDIMRSPNLKIIFDPVNLLDVDNYQAQDAIVKETIDLIGEDIVVLHLKDYQMVDGKMISCAAGTGMMNLAPVLSFAKARKPFIQATLEDTTPENAPQARKYLTELYERC